VPKSSHCNIHIFEACQLYGTESLWPANYKIPHLLLNLTFITEFTMTHLSMYLRFLSYNLEILTFNTSVHNINTRLKLKLHKPTMRLTMYQRSAYCNSINIYKKLPGDLAQWHTQEFCSGGGFNKFSWGQRKRGSGGGSPLVGGSGGSCNLA